MLTSIARVSIVAFTPMLRTTVGSGCVPIVVVSLYRCCAVSFCTSSVCTASCANTARWSAAETGRSVSVLVSMLVTSDVRCRFALDEA